MKIFPIDPHCKNRQTNVHTIVSNIYIIDSFRTVETNLGMTKYEEVLQLHLMFRKMMDVFFGAKRKRKKSFQKLHCDIYQYAQCLHFENTITLQLTVNNHPRTCALLHTCVIRLFISYKFVKGFLAITFL